MPMLFMAPTLLNRSAKSATFFRWPALRPLGNSMSSPPSSASIIWVIPSLCGEILVKLGEKPFHSGQVMKWIHHRFEDQFSEMTDLSMKLRSYLAEHGCLDEPKVVEELISGDGTRKWLIQSLSGSLIETVFIPEDNRGTLCVSSQVGCALDCSFCSTGKQGFNSNLTSAEIIGQVRIAIRRLAEVYPDRSRVVSNVVMMGMGEPC